MKLLTSLRSELLKTKRTAAFYLTIIAAVFGPFMSMLDASFSEGLSAGDRGLVFNRMMINKFEMTGLVLFPLFIVLICTLLAQIEYRNNSWKQVLASPQTRINIFIAKLLTSHLLMVIFLTINLLAMLGTVVVLHFKNPSLNILSEPVRVNDIVAVRLNIYGALLAMSAIQFWLGLRFKNFIVPIAIGIACWFIGTMLLAEMDSGFAAYFPYSFHVYGTFPKYKPELNNILWFSGGYTLVFVVFGFLDFKKRTGM